MAIPSVAIPYTTSARVTDLIGTLGLSLRDDDETDTTGDFMTLAINAGTSDADVYLIRYTQANCATDEYVAQSATWFAVRWWCLHRLNDLPAGVDAECKRREKLLEKVRTGKAKLRLPATRRAVVTTNYHVDLRKINDQVGVDTSRSTGIADGYKRVIDETAPDVR